MSPPTMLKYYVEIATAITTFHTQVNSNMADFHMWRLSTIDNAHISMNE